MPLCIYYFGTQGGKRMSKLKVVKPKRNSTSKGKVVFGKITPQLVAQALVVLAICGVFIFAMPSLPLKPTTGQNSGYTGVINLWIVDSFEGGSGSRASWFTKRSAKFETQHKGLFVCVTNLTEGQLQDKLQSGQNFDLLCFSRGVGTTVLDYLAPMDVDYGAILDNFAQSGRLNNTTYALPIYSGVYCLFARSSQQKGDVVSNCLNTTFQRKVGKNTVTLQPLVCGFAPYNNPLVALSMAGVVGKFTPDYAKSQYTAYEQFVANKTAVTLLGTQRDLYRLTKRVELGKMEQLLFAPLPTYTDLVTYIGVNKNTQYTSACLSYVQYLLSHAAQQTVADISMFSVTNQNLYSNDWYAQCQDVLARMHVPSLFADQQSINQERQTAQNTLNG